ncbi:hypothetical protein ACH9L7_00660 [Haloferax sp. S1W]|uniref:hypothetical protein n=1 Tax=Haloferax sp. S1W TaxID=3377110 RepID=UPI0037CB7379
MSTRREQPIGRRTYLKALGVGAVTAGAFATPAAAHRGGLKGELAKVRSATAKYNNLDNALADGYVQVTPFVPGQGYHYAKMSLIGTLDPLKPQALTYGQAGDGKPVYGSIEYLVPKAGQYANSPPDVFAHDDPDESSGNHEHWDIVDLNEGVPGADPFLVWALHVWVHTHNPDGVFHHSNPRRLFHPE